MENIGKFLRAPKAPTKGPNSERAELIGYFTDEINKERDGVKFKKVTPRYIAVKLAHLSKSDVYYIKNICEDYRDRGNSFSKCFFGSLRTNRNEV